MRGPVLRTLAVFTIFAMIATPIPAFAQFTPTSSGGSSDDEGPKKYPAGSRGLIFTLEGLDDIGAGSIAGGIGVKMEQGSRALRAVVDVDYVSSTEEDSDPDGNPNTGDSSKEERSAWRVTIAPAALMYLGGSRVRGYGGLEASLSMARTSATSEANDGSGNTSSSEAKNTASVGGIFPTTAFGIGLVLGAEVFAIEGLSVSAEYGFGYVRSSVPKSEVTANGQTNEGSVDASSSAIVLESRGSILVTAYF